MSAGSVPFVVCGTDSCYMAERSDRRKSLSGCLLASEVGRLLLATSHTHRYVLRLLARMVWPGWPGFLVVLGSEQEARLALNKRGVIFADFVSS